MRREGPDHARLSGGETPADAHLEASPSRRYLLASRLPAAAASEDDAAYALRLLAEQACESEDPPLSGGALGSQTVLSKRSARQQEANKQAQQRYRNKRKAQFEEMSVIIDQLGSRLRQAQAKVEHREAKLQAGLAEIQHSTRVLGCAAPAALSAVAGSARPAAGEAKSVRSQAPDPALSPAPASHLLRLRAAIAAVGPVPVQQGQQLRELAAFGAGMLPQTASAIAARLEPVARAVAVAGVFGRATWQPARGSACQEVPGTLVQGHALQAPRPSGYDGQRLLLAQPVLHAQLMQHAQLGLPMLRGRPVHAAQQVAQQAAVKVEHDEPAGTPDQPAQSQGVQALLRGAGIAAEELQGLLQSLRSMQGIHRPLSMLPAPGQAALQGAVALPGPPVI